MTSKEYKQKFNCFNKHDLTVAINGEIIGDACDFRFQEHTGETRDYNCSTLIELDMFMFQNTLAIARNIWSRREVDLTVRYDTEYGNSILYDICGAYNMGYKVHSDDEGHIIITMKFKTSQELFAHIATATAIDKPTLRRDIYSLPDEQTNYKVKVMIPRYCSKQELENKANVMEYDCVHKTDDSNDSIKIFRYHKFDYETMRSNLAIYSGYSCIVTRNGEALYGGLVNNAAQAVAAQVVKERLELEAADKNDTDTKSE